MQVSAAFIRHRCCVFWWSYCGSLLQLCERNV